MVNFSGYSYLVECQSNLHVGSGDNNYGVIDKQVQRDTISFAPVIHASGLKGALREYFEKCVNLDQTKIEVIFGSGKDERSILKQGAFRFFEAQLLSIPVRGIDNEPFYRATTPGMVDAFNKMAKYLENKVQINLPESPTGTVQTEYSNAPLLGNIPVIGDKTIQLEETVMTEVFKHLPLIARNSLDNGQSENLWYEEVIPRESRFYFFIAIPGNLDSTINFETDFNSHLHNKVIQIGASATVGYGYCKITKIA